MIATSIYFCFKFYSLFAFDSFVGKWKLFIPLFVDVNAIEIETMNKTETESERDGEGGESEREGER